MVEEEKALLSSLMEAISKGDIDEINRLKYSNLFYGSNLLDVIINYIFLSELGIGFNFGSRTIAKGTKLYRIRRYKSEIDFSNSEQWSYPPLMPENRANEKGEAALYLGTTENVCLLETHIKYKEKYVLGEYEVQEDIILGGFLDCEDYKKTSWYLAGVILNAFLIAPSRNEKNDELFAMLDSVYKDTTENDLKFDINTIQKMNLPLKFGVINKRNEFYKMTNRILKPIKTKYKDGIQYSSCYIPVSTVGVSCTDCNIVLYRRGMTKICFKQAIIKTNKNKHTGIDMLKIIIKVSE